MKISSVFTFFISISQESNIFLLYFIEYIFAYVENIYTFAHR